MLDIGEATFMLTGFFYLLFFLFAGEFIARELRLPLPGSILGMALLLVWLSLSRKRNSENLLKASDTILPNMPIMFVPVGVGIMAYWALLSQNSVAIGAALIVSTFIGLSVTAFTFGAVRRWRGGILPTITIGPTSMSFAEGSNGIMNYSFPVTRSGNLTGTSSVGWFVSETDTNMAEASDFIGSMFPSGTVLFAPNETSKHLVVQVSGNADLDARKTFMVTLGGASGATITTAMAQGTIASHVASRSYDCEN